MGSSCRVTPDTQPGGTPAPPPRSPTATAVVRLTAAAAWMLIPPLLCLLGGGLPEEEEEAVIGSGDSGSLVSLELPGGPLFACLRGGSRLAAAVVATAGRFGRGVVIEAGRCRLMIGSEWLFSSPKVTPDIPDPVSFAAAAATVVAAGGLGGRSAGVWGAGAGLPWMPGFVVKAANSCSSRWRSRWASWRALVAAASAGDDGRRDAIFGW